MTTILRRIPLLKRLYHIIYRRLEEHSISKPRRNSPPKIVFYPQFTTQAELLDAYNKAAFFLPKGCISSSVIAYNAGVAKELSSNITTWPTPDYCVKTTNYPHHVILLNNKPLDFLKQIIDADYLFVWDEGALSNNRWINTQKGKFIIIDRHTRMYDGWVWAEFSYQRQPKPYKEQQQLQAQLYFQEYIGNLPKFARSYIFGTGPSLDIATKFDFSDGYRIVCNTIVKNKDLIDYIQPHFIVAADAIYHFGNNKHAYQFRLDLEQRLRENPTTRFITTDNFGELLKHHHPFVYERTIPLQTGLDGIFLDMKNRLAYTNMHNILNSILLPLGSSLTDDVFLLGFDGRTSDNQIFWKNSEQNSYSNLKASIAMAHPGFFAGNSYYEKYAQWQSENAEKIMSMGERIGKRYYCMNKTAIPALQSRQFLAE